MNTQPQQFAFHDGTGRMVQKGDLIESFRGETWTFESASRPAEGNSTGRVLVSAACGDGVTPCAHMWHTDGIERREFFPSVFRLYLGTEDGSEA